MAWCEEEVLDDIPSNLLLFLGSISVNHVEVTIVATCNVFDSIFEYWIWNNHPFAAVVEVWVIGKDSCFLIETCVTHTDVVVVLVEELSCSCQRWVTEIISVWSPFLHELQSLYPSFFVYTSLLSIESTTKLLYHWNEICKFIRISEVETTASNDVSVSYDDLLADLDHVFPCLWIICLWIQTCISKYFLVDKD